MPAYSKTPLLKKLGIKANNTIYVFGHPESYFDLLGDLPEGVQLSSNVDEYDFIHLFAHYLKDLEQAYHQAFPRLSKTGMMWISWPKQASKLPTDLNRDRIRDYVLANGLVDVKVASINEVYSGLKFVFRLKDR